MPDQNVSTPAPPPNSLVQPPAVSNGPKPLWLIGFIVGLIVAASGGYVLGNRKPAPAPTVQTSQTDITVPEGATVIADCIDGLGKQYALPKDIPYGPIYNVNDGKVIGVEYMIGAADITKTPDRFMNLEGFKHPFDHVNVDYLKTGHAGHIASHFHIDLFTVSKEEASAIKCETSGGEHLHMH